MDSYAMFWHKYATMFFLTSHAFLRLLYFCEAFRVVRVVILRKKKVETHKIVFTFVNI